MNHTTLLLIRHGQTLANLERRVQGRNDDPLTELGQTQARAIAARLADQRPDALYVSPLGRARATAEIIGATIGIEPIVQDGLQEMDMGDLEEASDEQADAAYKTFTGIDDAYPNGESVRQFIERISAAIAHIAAAHPGQTVAVITHGGVIATLLAIWSGDGSTWMDFIVDNCSYTEVVLSDPPQISCVGDVSHV